MKERIRIRWFSVDDEASARANDAVVSVHSPFHLPEGTNYTDGINVDKRSTYDWKSDLYNLRKKEFRQDTMTWNQ